MQTRPYDVIGIGGLLVDHVLNIPESVLTEIGGDKGGMVTVDYDTFTEILNKSEEPGILVPGGSCANTIRGLAHLGHHCGMTGKIGKDSPGSFFLDSLQKIGVGTHLVECDTPTAQVACLVTPDGQRTMRTFLGAAIEMSEHDLLVPIFEKARLVHLEGYSLGNGLLTQTCMRHAKEAGAKISFSLSSFEIVDHFQEVIRSLLDEHVDIVFANEDEGHSLYGLSPRYCCQELSKVCEIAVVSEGAQGCYVGKGGDVVHCPALSVHAIDSIGAGDLFASGFLHGYLLGLDPETCGHLGCIAGAAAVEVRGASLSDRRWKEIRTAMESTQSKLLSGGA